MEHTLEHIPSKASSSLGIYGSFFLNGDEFAIGMADLQEVVNAPSKLQKMPLSPQYLLGLFNLRGRILPVVDLRILLKASAIESEGQVKSCMVVLRRGPACLGLIFDAVGEIVRVRPDEITPISRQNISSEVPDMPVSAVICRNNGERIIQILDLGILLNIRNMPLIEEMSHGDEASHTLTSRMKDLYREKLIGFRVGDCNLALEMKAVVAIVPATGKKPGMFSSELSKSVIVFNGRIVPVIDTSVLLGLGMSDTLNQILVCRVGAYHVGFEVDAISSIIPYAKDKIAPVPVLEDHRSSIFRGCFTDREGKDFIVLNEEGMVSKKEIVSISVIHTTLSHDDKPEEIEERTASKVSLLTFRMGKLYGVRLRDVLEVLVCPKELVRAPNMPPSVLGILNLRGNPISVVDPRQLFELEPTAECTDSKLVVFRHENSVIAMRVDSVESITSVSEKTKDELPAILFNNDRPRLKDTFEKGVSIVTNGEDTVVLILGSDQLAQRLSDALVA